MSKNKAQHYLSAFYLYNFTNERQRAENGGRKRRKTNVFHYDLRKGEIKERPIEKIATESYLLSYTDNDGNLDHSVDDRLKLVETCAANAFEELNKLYQHISKHKPRAVKLSNDVIEGVIDLLVWQIVRHPGLIAEFEEECDSYLTEKGFEHYSSKRMALDVVESIIDEQESSIREQFDTKNKTIICTTNEHSQFITTDKPFVRFNKDRNNGIGVEGTEMYFPLASNMLLLMYGNGEEKKFVLNNDRSKLRALNIYLAKHAERYLVAKDDTYLARIHKGIANKPLHKDKITR